VGLMLKHQDSKEYLTPVQHQTLFDWLKQKNYWHLLELKEYIEDSFAV
jgi:transposase